jgi:hypothetical protein
MVKSNSAQGSVDRTARLCHDPRMDLEAARKGLAKRSAFSAKRVAFLVVAGAALIAGVLLRAGYFGRPDVEQNAPVTVPASPPPQAVATPPAETTESVAKIPAPVDTPAAAPSQPTAQAGGEQAGQTDAAVPPADQADLPGAGMILVSRQPVEVRASPSASAPTTYGFPAGRPFRVIGHEGGFAQIKDLRSGATGWIDEAALVPPPRVPTLTAPSRVTTGTATAQPKAVAIGGKAATPPTAAKPKVAGKGGQVAAGSEDVTDPDLVQPDRRPGLLGGVFRGIFGGGN